MDPDANLAEARTIVRELLDDDAVARTKAARLAELVEALDLWIGGGGHLPAAWRPL